MTTFDVEKFIEISDEEFTKAEKARINALYGNDFDCVCADDIPLIIRWEHHNALTDLQFRAWIEMKANESNARVEEMQAKADASREKLRQAINNE